MADTQYRSSLMAASIISAIPIIIIVFIFGQKYFTEGISKGGIKG